LIFPTHRHAIRAIPCGVALFLSCPQAASLPLLAEHLQLDALHLEGEAPASERGSFVRMDLSDGPGLDGILQGTAVRIERPRLTMTARLDSAALFVRAQVDAAPANDELAFPQVTFRRHGSWPASSLEMGAGKDWWMHATLHTREGRQGLTLEGGQRNAAFEVQAGGGYALEKEAWSFVLPTGEALACGWNSHTATQSLGLVLAPRSASPVEARIGRTQLLPSSSSAFWNLSDSGTAQDWSLAWKPRLRGWRATLSHRQFESHLTTIGWGQDSGQERRRFHALDWNLDGYRQEASLQSGPWSVGIGRQKATLDLTGLRFPFLAWNALDQSSWSAFTGLFETRNDRLKGQARLESQWLRLEVTAFLSRLGIRPAVELTHLEAKAILPWSRRKSSIDLSSSLETDTLGLRPLETWVLWPSVQISRSWRNWELSASAVQALPLWIHQESATGSQGSGKAATSSPGTEATGGHLLRLTLTRQL